MPSTSFQGWMESCIEGAGHRERRRRRTRGWDYEQEENDERPARIEDGDGDGDDGIQRQPIKRRRLLSLSVTGSGQALVQAASRAFSTAVEAVAFSAVLGMAAYKLWQGSSLDDADRHHDHEPNGQLGPFGSHLISSSTSTSTSRQYKRSAEEEEDVSLLQVQVQEEPPPYESVYAGGVRLIARSYYSSSSSSSARSVRSRLNRHSHPVSFSFSHRKRVRGLVHPSSSSSPQIRTRLHSVPSPYSSSISTSSTPPSMTVSPTFSSDFSFTSPDLRSPDVPADSEGQEREREQDDLFASISSRLQSLIQQGNEALNSAVDVDVDIDAFAGRDRDEKEGYDDARNWNRRRTLPARQSIPSVPARVGPDHRDGKRHRSRLSMG